jgi:CTP:molybdopterin cytidylyltransferase MocA
MEVKRICKWCGKPFIAKKTTTNYCSHQCASQGYKHRMRERRLELRELQDLIEVKSKLDHQDYFTFAQPHS